MGLHFTKEEFAERKYKVIKELKNQGIDALLMFRQESMYWLTGYDTFGFVFFQCLILTVKGDLILLTRAPDLRQAQNTSIIKPYIKYSFSRFRDYIIRIIIYINFSYFQV